MGGRFSQAEPAADVAVKEKEEIEESIIEEDIQVHQDGDSPGTPLINSRTKGKGKDLRLMRPPKPFNNNGKPSPMNGKAFNNMHHVEKGADASQLTEIPEQHQSQSKNVSHQQQEETFDEFYPMPKSRQVLDEVKRPFSPPIK